MYFAVWHTAFIIFHVSMEVFSCESQPKYKNLLYAIFCYFLNKTSMDGILGLIPTCASADCFLKKDAGFIVHFLSYPFVFCIHQ